MQTGTIKPYNSHTDTDTVWPILHRLRVDDYEYVSMKVIVLLTADTSEIREKETVRESQEKVIEIFFFLRLSLCLYVFMPLSLSLSCYIYSSVD